MRLKPAVDKIMSQRNVHFRYLSYCMDENRIRTQDFFKALTYLSYSPVGRLYLWDWMKQNYEQLVDR